MASQWLLITTPPPSQEEILDSLAPRCVWIEVRLPLLVNPPDAQFPCWESLDVFEAINAHVSAQVRTFFNAVRARQDMYPAEDDVRCEIKICEQRFGLSKGGDCWHRTFHTRRLTVQSPDTLPLLDLVTELCIFSETKEMDVNVRPLSPRVPLDLATRLPHLRKLECPCLWERHPIAFVSQALRKFGRVWAGPWRDSRAEFARGVHDTMPLFPTSLTKARLWFWEAQTYGGDMDQTTQMPDLVSVTREFEGKDPVSLGLRTLGSRLEELDVRAFITPDLFPADSSATGHCWPTMRQLKVEFHPCAPDGRWYFSGPRGEDPYPAGFVITQEEHYPPGQDDDEELHDLLSDETEEWSHTGDALWELYRPDMFRILPIAERMNPLLLAFASSIQRDKMPCLQDAELFTWLKWHPSEERAHEYTGSDDAPHFNEDEPTTMFRWGLRYDGPQEGGDGKGKLTWQVGRSWKPGPEVMEAFEELVGVNTEWKEIEFVEHRDRDYENYF
ncbi:hypothetical protein QBC44DRAFT_398507 [Cladorrhinum sp. PSN332]|nr:hypothetical protein QBC44DRAFT_398507 [Cladorrhinum sp. PSN332]